MYCLPPKYYVCVMLCSPLILAVNLAFAILCVFKKKRLSSVSQFETLVLTTIIAAFTFIFPFLSFHLTTCCFFLRLLSVSFCLLYIKGNIYSFLCIKIDSYLHMELHILVVLSKMELRTFICFQLTQKIGASLERQWPFKNTVSKASSLPSQRLSPWVGLRKINVSYWGWEDMTPFTNSSLRWLPGEPSDSGFCAYLEEPQVIGLRANPCTATAHGLICEKATGEIFKHFRASTLV